MPTRDGAAFLPAALDSIRSQLGGDVEVEVVVVDDGSTDETPALLAAAARDMPLRVLERRTGNWAANSNHGLQASRGEYACFLHQDDLWLPGRIEALAAVVSKGGARLWLHDCWFLSDDGRRLGRWRCPLPATGAALAPELVLERLLVQNWIGIPAPLFRREDALAAGGLDESLWYTSDWDLWLKLAALGPTRYLRRPLAGFRVHATSQTVRRARRLGELSEQCRRVQARHLPLWRAEPRRRLAVERAAALASDVNGWLAERFAGQPQSGAVAVTLAARFLRLGPAGWRRFLRDSRLTERVGARLRAGLHEGAGRRRLAT